MNPKSIVEDAVAISRLLIAGSSSCLLYNLEKLNSITICPSELQMVVLLEQTAGKIN